MTMNDEFGFTDAEIKEDLWAWNDFQDKLEAEEKAREQDNEL
jgi:hypothetical protein